MKTYQIDLKNEKDNLIPLIEHLSSGKHSQKETYALLKKFPKSTKGFFSKSDILIGYERLKNLGEISLNSAQESVLYKNAKMKKIRTLSGVTPVTVLTKPFPCPGKCIFCPSDVRMPKSYLSDEPGAQRALLNKFDPYLQTFNRLVAFKNMGHSVEKIELLILGGTWSSYPETYQIWFVKRCFDAMNEFDSLYDTKMLDTKKAELPFDEKKLESINGNDIQKTYNQIISGSLQNSAYRSSLESATWEQLYHVHSLNEKAKNRCIGLVIETRPDEITKKETMRIRKLGATRVQIGIQSLNDQVLKKNKRGHDVKKTQEALLLLRQAGFKVLGHWMPNLYGSNPKADKKDFDQLFLDEHIRPDELKIYPCSLISSAELMKYYKSGEWKPYTQGQLADVLIHAMTATPRYCRLPRVIRDIPSTDIVTGNKMTNFRQYVEQIVAKSGNRMVDIRAREIKNSKLSVPSLQQKITKYDTPVSQELFIEFVTPKDKIAGFLRLSLPTQKNFISEIDGLAMIREIHVYGVGQNLGETSESSSQHLGLGKQLISIAKEKSKSAGFKEIAVISSVGTREYYKKFGFKKGDLYQIAQL